MAGKKKTETPVVEVSVTTTKVAEKPKRTRKKSATNTREVAAVISEITEKKSTVNDTTTAVSKILNSRPLAKVPSYNSCHFLAALL